jgi:hypothetical protein
MVMSSEDSGDDAIPVEGDVRFNSAGQLETFDGADWVPLQRISDVEPTSVFRFQTITALQRQKDQPPDKYDTRGQADAADESTSS